MTRLSLMPKRERCFFDAYHALAAALFAIGTLTLAAHAQSPPDTSAPPADEPAAAQPALPQPAGGSDATPPGRSEPKRKEKDRQQRAPGKTPGPTLGAGFGGASGGGLSGPPGSFQNRGMGGTGVFGGGGMMTGAMGGGPGGFGSTGMGGRGDTASLLERALRYSPDVQLAEAKLRTAEAEVNRARLEVAKSVIGLEHSMASQQRIIELEKVRLQQARESHKRLDDLVKKGLTPSSSESAASLALKEAESELISAEAKLSELRETLRYMMGGAMPGIPPGMSSYWQDSSSRPLPGGPSPGASGEPSGGVGLSAPPAAESVNPPGKMPSPAGSNTRAATSRVPSWTIKTSEAADTPHNNLRRKLQSPTQVQLKESYPKDLAKYLQDLHGVAFLTDPDVDKGDHPISIDIRDVPLHAALQAIEDTNPHVRFFVRDYGILIALSENEGAANKAVRVRDFVQEGQHAPIVKYEIGPGGQYSPFYAPPGITDPRATPAAKDPKPIPPAKPPGKPAAEIPAKP